ncbi:MAG TPA: flagellar basal body-associated FliL family protein [Steroidobacter sp.]|nr:flagellar basal body-associated FliL family protein [Steroidobacteraceae bacterium]HLS81607.1 flagellar basal body-associated FliL family protein [Steroidobacter sp.]
MKTSGMLIGGALLALLGVCGGGAAAWWVLSDAHGASGAVQESPRINTRAYKYIDLEKVVVLLRQDEREPMRHYLALDLVFKTPLAEEKVTREHLPLLRSAAVAALSPYTRTQISAMSVEELKQTINDAYLQTYAQDPKGRPFEEALIAKLIVE